MNLVDSVTSRILHRVSHANANPHKPVPVVLTKNWIVYAYHNSASKRTDLGVLTLHKGMIGKHDVTAFSTRVEQADDEHAQEAARGPLQDAPGRRLRRQHRLGHHHRRRGAAGRRGACA